MRLDRRTHATEDSHILALLGNPNVGKSTLFNLLTDGKQHTGNWAGKTVELAQGDYRYKGRTYFLTDLPGTYSLLSSSEEEKVALEYLHNGDAKIVVIVADATCLERNLSFALQVMEHIDRVLLCINMMDEAERDGISIDMRALRLELGIPVVGISASHGAGIEDLKETIRQLADGFLPSRPIRSYEYTSKAAEIMKRCVSGRKEAKMHRLDNILLGRRSGPCAMLFALMMIFWLTIVGASYPSDLLQSGLSVIGGWLRVQLYFLPQWMCSLLLDGIYVTTARVISVMLPPILIFFILFTVLEDLGYLPRAAFLTDHVFERCASCGKQVLTMSMGFGCNAVGVAGCRIIASPRERLLAIVTNTLVPCNGRFPALIALATVLYPDEPLLAAALLIGMILMAVVTTLLSTKILGMSVLRGSDSHFIMEMPPYRRPNLKKILRSAVKDRTLFVLTRASMVAAPAGALIWLVNKIVIGGEPLLMIFARALDPVGLALGMNGLIILAFILSFPANELLMPLIVMFLSGDVLSEVGAEGFAQVFSSASWSKATAVCMMVFVLFHWPCSTTCLTVHKETKSWVWTGVSLLLPTMIGVILCALINVCLN